MDLSNKSNDDLRYIIKYTDKKDEAGAQLLKQLGIENLPNEKDLIIKISNQVLEHPDTLYQKKWHKSCGTAHCIAGWATVLSPEARIIEKAFDTEFAGQMVLPNYKKLFYKKNKEVKEYLKTNVLQM